MDGPKPIFYYKFQNIKDIQILCKFDRDQSSILITLLTKGPILVIATFFVVTFYSSKSYQSLLRSRHKFCSVPKKQWSGCICCIFAFGLIQFWLKNWLKNKFWKNWELKSKVKVSHNEPAIILSLLLMRRDALS